MRVPQWAIHFEISRLGCGHLWLCDSAPVVVVVEAGAALTVEVVAAVEVLVKVVVAVVAVVAAQCSDGVK